MIQLYHHPPCRLFHNVSLKARPPARKIISHEQNVGETARKPASNPHTAPPCALRVNRTEDEGTFQPEPSTMWAGRT